jgi:hypothetical protein
VATGSGPLGIAFDGTNIWVVNAGGKGIGTVSKVLASNAPFLAHSPRRMGRTGLLLTVPTYGYPEPFTRRSCGPATGCWWLNGKSRQQ